MPTDPRASQLRPARARQRAHPFGRTAGTVLLTLTVAGCSDTGGDPRTSWSGTVDTLPNGTIHVVNPADGTWPAGGGWRLVEELRIGRADGTGPDVFGEITAVGVSPADEIHVIDGHAQELRVFAADGSHLRTLGRRGGGPGEFGGAFGLSWDREGNLWVIDPGNARYAVYGPDGTLLRNVRRQVPGTLYPWLGGRADGVLYDPAARGREDGAAVFTHYRVDEDGSVADSLPPLVRPPLTSGPMLSMKLLRLTPRPILAFDERGYLWSAITDEYRLVQREFAGDTARIISRPYRRAPLTAADRDTIRRELAEPGLENFPAELRNPQIPSLRPALERIYIADDGHVFVQPVGDGSAPPPLDVFDPDGRYLGPLASELHLLPLPALPVFRDGRAWGVIADELGVLHVVRARIERGPAA